MSALSLADAKTHLNITGTDDDTELQSFIDAAEAVIALRCGPLASTATTSRVEGGSVLILPVSPAISLTSVTPVGGSALSLTGISLAAERGVVSYDSGSAFSARLYDVVYDAGRSSVPADLMLAVKELVRHMWATQRGNQPAFAGALPDDEGELVTNTATYLFPRRVEQLIARHEQVDI